MDAQDKRRHADNARGLRSLNAPGRDRPDALMAITLRTFADSDLDALLSGRAILVRVQMAAFTRANPSDRNAFDARYERVRRVSRQELAPRSSSGSIDSIDRQLIPP
jgi:hypothetical protein